MPERPLSSPSSNRPSTRSTQPLPRTSELGELYQRLRRARGDGSDAGEPLEPSPSPSFRLTAQLDPLLLELKRAHRARQELDASFLVVGLLGGTGVGKSTLLNALAGEAISKAGDRRPTTERAVCYRHQNDPLPTGIDPADLAEGTLPHDRDALRGVTLIDLPDVDSHARGHRQVVHRMLEHLDLLLVVSNVEKYSDAVLYEEVVQFPQAPRNMVFVLNAVDRVSDTEQEAIADDFHSKLERLLGFESPQLLTTSALSDPPGDRRGSLTPLRQLLEELGGESARRQVLLHNFDTQLDRCANMWEELWRGHELDTLLASIESLETAPPIAPRTRDALRGRLENVMAPWARDRAQRASWFPIGPAYFVVRKLRRKGWVDDPLRDDNDPLDDYAQECLWRPLRLARQRFQEFAYPHRSVFTFDAPPKPEGSPTGSISLQAWLQRLERRIPKLAWKLRQHLIPLLFGITSLGHITVTMIPDQDRGTFGTLWQSLQNFLLAMNPGTWIGIGIGLLLYYFAVYPYFLYRLERALHSESNKGAALYIESWSEQFEQLWIEPLRSSREQLQRWWKHADRLAHRVGLRRATTVD